MVDSERAIDRLVQVIALVLRAGARFRDRVLPTADRQRDAYLSGAVDRVDLEQRIRNWERRPTPFWDGV